MTHSYFSTILVLIFSEKSELRKKNKLEENSNRQVVAKNWRLFSSSNIDIELDHAQDTHSLYIL